MDFNVKGITFKDSDLEKILLEDLEVGSISKHHIFYSLSNGKKMISLLYAGDLVEENFLNKYKVKGVESFYGLRIASNEEVTQYKQLWTEFRRCRSQKAKMLTRDSIILKLVNDFVRESDTSFLNYTIATFETFFNLPTEILETYQSRSVVLYTRSLLMSSKLTILSLAGNYLDYDFIKDFYNTGFLLDYGLVKEFDFNYSISQACEKERNIPGSGIVFLEKTNRPVKEINLFKLHPLKSFELATVFQHNFKYPEVLDYIKLHHEKGDGSGFPKGYHYASMGLTEGLLIYCDYLIPFHEHIFSKGDGGKIFISYFEDLKEINKQNNLPIKAFVEMWESVLEWGDREAEVAG